MCGQIRIPLFTCGWKSQVEGTAAQQHRALDWRWKITGILSFRLNELGLDGEASHK